MSILDNIFTRISCNLVILWSGCFEVRRMSEKTLRSLVQLVILFSYCLQGEASESHDLATTIEKLSTYDEHLVQTNTQENPQNIMPDPNVESDCKTLGNLTDNASYITDNLTSSLLEWAICGAAAATLTICIVKTLPYSLFGVAFAGGIEYIRLRQEEYYKKKFIEQEESFRRDLKLIEEDTEGDLNLELEYKYESGNALFGKTKGVSRSYVGSPSGGAFVEFYA